MTPEAARDRKLGVKMQTLRVIMCPGRGSWMTLKSCQKSKIGGHFFEIGTYDPMSPSSATPAHRFFEKSHLHDACSKILASHQKCKLILISNKECRFWLWICLIYNKIDWRNDLFTQYCKNYKLIMMVFYQMMVAILWEFHKCNVVVICYLLQYFSK